MIRILLVDDQNLVQQGIKSLLDHDPDFKVIGTVKDGRTAVKQIDVLRPDIVLLDIEMPGMDGITATKYITRLSPNTKVIILSSHEDKKYLTQALMAGAKAYILKSSLMKDLRQAILAVHGGYSHIESRLLAKIFDPTNLKLRNSKSESEIKQANHQTSQSSNISLDRLQTTSSPTVNPLLPAVIIQRSSLKLTPTSKAAFPQLSAFVLKSKNYLNDIHVRSKPQILKYREQITQFYQLKKSQWEPRVRSLKVKIVHYQSQLSPIIKQWYQKGWLANAGLVLLGLITVFIIQRMFS